MFSHSGAQAPDEVCSAVSRPLQPRRPNFGSGSPSAASCLAFLFWLLEPRHSADSSTAEAE